MKTKTMELADGWYPKNKKLCYKEINSFLNQYPNISLKNSPVGGIVPHAGWYFSGKLSCKVISLLAESNVDVIAVFGGHLKINDLITYYDYDLFETPFGNIELHKPLFDKVINEIKNNSEPNYLTDNTVEIQLPFIKYFFPNTKIVAFRSPPSNLSANLGQLIANKAKELNLKLITIGSTDLTHYGPNYSFMPAGLGEKSIEWVKNINDNTLINYLSKMDEDLSIEHATQNSSACSVGAAISCISASKALGRTKGNIIDYYTSYDVMKNDSFVGYVGMVF